MRWYQRFFRRGLTEKHFDADLRFHLEQQIGDYIGACAQSTSESLPTFGPRWPR
jgi:hypothetical protein